MNKTWGQPGAAGISFKGTVKPMGRCHFAPAPELVRHLCSGSASEGVIRAAEHMQCKTCAKHSKVKSARVDFYQAVALHIVLVHA